MLNWTLTICTYNRPHFLVETLRYAIAQTRPPAQVVVVDASDNWEDHKAQMQRTFAETWDKIELNYVPAEVRSLTFQRNQALRLARHEIVFSLDDDIYLRPDAAEAIMIGYEADPQEDIAMIAGLFVDGVEQPNLPEASTQPPLAHPSQRRSLKARLKQLLENQLTLDSHFVPYQADVDRSAAPAALASHNIVPGGLINGGRTTFRRKIGAQVGWSELLRYYATHEDSDFSYRMSYHGRLLVAPDAGFFHADGNEGNASRYRVNTIRVRNLMALHVLHSRNKVRSACRLVASFSKFLAIYMIIDAVQKRLSFPTARAYALGLMQIPMYLFWPRKDFAAWYAAQQEAMYGNRYKS